MNWGKVKTILIVLFFCVDAFLLSNIIISTVKSSAIPREIVQSSVQLLNQNGISISEELIPRKIHNAKYVQADNIINDYNDFSLRIAEGSKTSGENVTFSNDYFSCTDLNEEYSGIKDEHTALSAAREYLSGKGFDISHTKASSQKTQSGYSITFQNYNDGLPLFNSSVTVTTDNTGITGISGSWFNITESDNQENALKNVTGILIDFMSSRNDTTPIKISGLEMGYSLFDNDTYHKSAVLIPTWKISTEDGNVFYMDARNAE